MIGKQDRWQEDLFVACPLSELIPDDHVLKRVDKVLDLSWLREEVRELYSETQGRPSIDPESAVRLMLAGFFQGVVHDRKLMREAQVNLAIRWFAGYRLHERLPHHSSLTRIRQRWGAGRFKRIFQKTVQLCADAGLVDGETVHMDATLIRADVSWASLTEHHAERVLEENVLEEEQAGERVQKRARKPKKRSTTDPDATMTTSSNNYRMEPSFKQHTAVDDAAGVIVDVEVTTGEASEGQRLPEQLERVEATTGKKVATVTGDTGYAHSSNYALLEERDTEAVIPPQPEPRKAKRIPLRRFKYDAKHGLVRCPTGKMLHRGSRGKNGWWYRAKLLRARRRRRRWDEATQGIYTRHRWGVEGVHAEAKTRHGLRRAVRRGLSNVAIQVYLTAAVINLKRLAACLMLFLPKYVVRARRLAVANPVWRRVSGFYGTELRLGQMAA